MNQKPQSPNTNCRVHAGRPATHTLRGHAFCCECFDDALEHSANIDAPQLKKWRFGKLAYRMPPEVFEEMLKRILESRPARTVSNSETSPHGVSNPS